MGENGTGNGSENRTVLTVKNVLRILSLLCIIFVFCPSFLVSCSGQKIDVSVMTAVGGMSMYGEKVVDPYPIMLLCLLLPLLALVLLFVKKFAERKAAGMILGGMAIDLVIWVIFRATVKKLAEENYCSFKTTPWYVINMIMMVLVLVFAALVVFGKMQMEADLAAVFSGKGTQDALKQMSETVSQMSSAVTQMAGNVAGNVGNKTPKEDIIGYCSKCGKPLAYGNKFCTSCGTLIPESLLAEAEAARKAAEEAAEAARKAAEEAAARKAAEEAEAQRAQTETEAAQTEQTSLKEIDRPKFCQQCGAKLGADAKFCESCGTKVG